jgi:hypothetical protein
MRGNAPLQHRAVEHVEKPAKEEAEIGWFKICKGKMVRQNIDPLLESRRVLGIEKTILVFLRPRAGNSVTHACQRPWRKPGDDIQCFVGIIISIKTIPCCGQGKNNISPRPSLPKTGKQSNLCPHKTTCPAIEKIFVPGHLDTLLYEGIGSLRLGFQRRHRRQKSRVRWESAMRAMEVEEILAEKVVDLAVNNSSGIQR